MTLQDRRRFLRIAAYVLLVLSATTTFVAGDRLWTAARVGELPLWAPLVAPVVFTIFVIVYTIDRWMLVRRRTTSLARALLQVGFAITFLTLLWPPQAAHYRETRDAARSPSHYAVRLLAHHDEAVRAAACELLGLRSDLSFYEQIERMAGADDAELVKAKCGEARDRLAAARAPAP